MKIMKKKNNQEFLYPVKQLNINSPFSKATLDSGEDVDDFDLGVGEEEDDLDDDGELDYI